MVPFIKLVGRGNRHRPSALLRPLASSCEGEMGLSEELEALESAMDDKTLAIETRIALTLCCTKFGGRPRALRKASSKRGSFLSAWALAGI